MTETGADGARAGRVPDALFRSRLGQRYTPVEYDAAPAPARVA
jgi:hypothetical protein